MLGSSQKTVIVVDAMASRRARVENFLAPWASDESVNLISAEPEEARAKLVEDIDVVMLVFNVGGSLSLAHDNIAEILVLRTLRPTAAVVVLSDDESLASILAAIHGGAQGYLNNSMPSSLALQALSFILRGGCYFPPEAILMGHANHSAMQSCEDQSARLDSSHLPAPSWPQQQNQISMTGAENGLRQQQGLLVDEPTARDASSRASDRGIADALAVPYIAANPSLLRNKIKLLLSERQYAVFQCLCRGDPNKVIGRSLSMTEATVKVHVREIMRKLGVVNRTQVAIAATQFGSSAEPLVKLVTTNPAVTSSVGHQH